MVQWQTPGIYSVRRVAALDPDNITIHCLARKRGARLYFGPTGVRKDMRGKGIGKALLLRCLYSMYERGYNYAIIGWVGPAEFYQKACGATMIPDSTPRSYRRMITVDA